MSPNGKKRTNRLPLSDDLYCALLALAAGVVIATAAYVAVKCYSQYDTVFGAPKKASLRYNSYRR